MNAYNNYSIFEATYKADTEEVYLETTYPFTETLERVILKTAQLKDKAMLEVLPDDILLGLFSSCNEELTRRNKQRNDERFGMLKSTRGSETK